MTRVSTRTIARRNRAIPLTSLLVAVSLVAGCAGADYDERMTYLRTIALRGLEAHNLLRNQGTSVDDKSCRLALKGLIDDIPDDIGGAEPRASKEWTQLVEQTF